MEEEEGGPSPRLSKRVSDKGVEVDYKTKAGTAWSHSYLNQKPWHPLSYPNQRRKWIAEQTHAQRQRRVDELSREYAQEQEFLRQTSLLSQKEKEKVDMMQAVSFMYVRPPGYNAESAKAAEISDERKNLGENEPTVASSSSVQQTAPVKEEKKKHQPKDVFGRRLPTEEEFAILKNAPRLETGVAGRAKPFAVEVRNVKCVRCGNFGHQSGDRECPLKDAIMPNDESRLKRDDPLTAIMAHMDSSEPLKWELKQRPGISPPRGGFMPDDPNQQIVAEDIFDEYGGFLSGGGIPELLTNFSTAKHKRKKSKSKRKHRRQSSSRRSHDDDCPSESDDDRMSLKTKLKSRSKHKKQASLAHRVEEDDSYSEDRHQRRTGTKEQSHKSKKKKKGPSHSSRSDDSESETHHGKKLASPTHSSEENYTSDTDRHRRRSKREESMYKSKRKEKDSSHYIFSEDSASGKSHRKHRHKHSHVKHDDSDKDRKNGSHQESRALHKNGSSDGERKSMRKEKMHRSCKTTRDDPRFSSEESEVDRYRDRKKHKRSCSSENSDSDDHRESRHHRGHHQSS